MSYGTFTPRPAGGFLADWLSRRMQAKNTLPHFDHARFDLSEGVDVPP